MKEILQLCGAIIFIGTLIVVSVMFWWITIPVIVGVGIARNL